MTSYLDITATVNHVRRRLKKTSINGATIRQIFGDDSGKLLPIPVFIDDYNQHMGGVDIADELRSFYSTQRKACRNRLPLLFWLHQQKNHLAPHLSPLTLCAGRSRRL